MSRPASSTDRTPLEARLLEVIALQNAIAAADNSLEDVLSIVVSRAPELTAADAGVVEFREGEEMVYRAVSGTAEPFRGLRLHVDESLSGLAVKEGRVLRCDDAAADPRVDRLAAEAVGALSMLCVPLQDRGQVARAARYDRPLSVARFSFDPLSVGEEATARLTALIARVRGGDEPFRLAPGEFAVLLPETDEAGAARMATRVAAAARPVALAWGVAERAGGGPRDLHSRAGAAFQR